MKAIKNYVPFLPPEDEEVQEQSDTLTLLFGGKVYPLELRENYWLEIDLALKTYAFCHICSGLESCRMYARGWQVIYDHEAAERNPNALTFRWRKCRYWKDEKKDVVTPRGIDMTFENFEVTDDNRDAYESCKRYAEEFSEQTSKGLLLMGPVGTGKTHLAFATAKEIYRRVGISVGVINIPEFLEDMRDVMRSEYPADLILVKKSAEKHLIILDDFGVEKITDWVREQLYIIINNRYEQMLPVIATTNCNLEQLERHLGARIFDRLIEMCEVCKITGKSWRRRKT